MRSRNATAQMVKENYVPPEFAIFHWDSKMFKGIGSVKVDHVAICVSYPAKLIGRLYFCSFFRKFTNIYYYYWHIL